MVNIPNNFSALTGNWIGIKRIWLSPGELTSEAAARAVISTSAQGKFLNIQYDWMINSETQDGLLLVGFDIHQRAVGAAWIDSFHNNDQIMLCKAENTENGEVRLSSSYKVPNSPDWGWRIDLISTDTTGFRMVMYNVSPDGQAYLGVEAIFNQS